MSFILDALKKAESERHLGELPGIHSQNQTPSLVANDTGRWWRRDVRLAVALTLAGLAAIGLAWRATQPGPARITVLEAAPGPIKRVPEPAPLPAQPDAAPVAALPPPAVAEPSRAPLMRAMAAPGSTPKGVAAELPVPPSVPKPVIIPKKETPPTLAAPIVAKSAKPQVAAAEPANVLAVSQLPANIRGELPVLAIGGSIYSANPADRMLLMDKRMLREGDEISPGLVLEAILPKAANLRYKGFVFRITY